MKIPLPCHEWQFDLAKLANPLQSELTRDNFSNPRFGACAASSLNSGLSVESFEGIKFAAKNEIKIAKFFTSRNHINN